MFDIRSMPPAVDATLLEAARKAEPATIGHVRINGFPHPDIRALVPVTRIAGTAVTLMLPAADSTLLHHCVGMLRAGDVLVVDRLGDTRHACFGGGVAVAISRQDVAGVIVDGPCADPQELRDAGLCVWGRGFSSITTRLQGIGGIMNAPVCLGGCVVMPGDLIIADEGGIVVLPPNEAMAAIQRAGEMQAREAVGSSLVGPDSPLGKLTGASAMVEAKLYSPAIR